MSEKRTVTTPLKSRYWFENYFRSLFNKYDRDRDGYITIDELNDLIKNRNNQNIPVCAEEVQRLHDIDQNRKLDFEEFLDVAYNPEFNWLFGHYINRYIAWLMPRKRRPPSQSASKSEHEQEYSCHPPAVGIIIISIFEIIFFSIDKFAGYDLTKYASGPTAAAFIYEPYKRYQVWRYVTYMFVHLGLFHLFINLAIQIVLGIFLEMVHGWWRVLIIYFSGVLAGSLATSIIDPNVKLAGASGAVYALFTAHIASIIMNWKEMTSPLLQLLIFFIVAGSDMGTAIYYRYVLNTQSIGSVAHVAGALAGLLVGINILRNLRLTPREIVVWWVSITAFTTLMAVGIIWNLAWADYFPKNP